MTDEPDYEAEYNNRARVPDHGAIINAWAREAEAYRGSAAAELDLAYGDAPRHELDLFLPRQDRGGPITLFIHGGYWQSFDRSWFSHFARGLNTHGVAVAIPSYRLCPQVTIADIVEDMHACCLWLETHYGRPVLAVGHSAGGHLAATLLASDWTLFDDRRGHRLVPAAVAISGLFDLQPLIHTSINANLHLTERSAHDLSPTAWTPPAGTWLSAMVGGDESLEFHRQARMIVDVWHEHGVHTDLLVVDGTNHFTIASRLADPESEVTETIATLSHSLE